MRKHAARVDDNQGAIVAALRRCGADVRDLSRVGDGLPDLLVGWRGQNFLLEIKTPRGELNTRQRNFQAGWRGQTATVRTISEALAAIGAIEQ